MSATLGGLLKDLRLQYKISQLEIAFGLGWKETSRLSRIEQGKVSRPKRELLDKITQSMQLTEEDKNQLLLVGSYLPFPSEIKNIQKTVQPVINKWPYPATVLDFSWRIITDNPSLYKLYNIAKIQQEFIAAHNPNIIEVVFDPEFILNKNLSKQEEVERKKFHITMLSQFIFEQRSRVKDKWYTTLVRKMMDNKSFSKVWAEAQRSRYPINIINMPLKAMHLKTTDTKLSFYFLTTQITKDPRFSIQFNLPADEQTFNFYNTH